MLNLRRLRYLASNSGKKQTLCLQPQQQIKAFEKYLVQHLPLFQKALETKNLDYGISFGKNASIFLSNNLTLYKSIKQNFVRNIQKIRPERCLEMAQIFKEYEFQGDQQPILTDIKKCVESNYEVFSDQELSKLEDLYLEFHVERLPFKKIKPVFEASDDTISYGKKQAKAVLQRCGVVKNKLIYSYQPNRVLLTDPASNKTFRIVTLDEIKDANLEQWLHKLEKEIVASQALILQLPPIVDDLIIYPQKQSQLDRRAERLLKMTLGDLYKAQEKQIRSESGRQLKGRLLSQYFKKLDLDDARVDPNGFCSGLAILFARLTPEVFHQKQVLLCGHDYQHKIQLMAESYTQTELRQMFGLARLSYINEQGRYLIDKSLRGCEKCGGLATLQVPVEAAGPDVFSEYIPDRLLAANIYEFMKKSPCKSFTAIMEPHHIGEVFGHLSKFYSSGLGKQVEQAEKDYTRDSRVAKLAMISSLYLNKMRSLPNDLNTPDSNRLYQLLYDTYSLSLHPFGIHCSQKTQQPNAKGE